MCRKLQRTDPKLIHEKVSPSETVLEGRVQVQPLTYILKPFTLPDEAPTGALICESAAAVAVGDLAANTTFEVEVGGKVTMSRPEPELDERFESKSDQVELDRGFDLEKSYTFKMPIKSL
ncbi:MAP3K2 [Symbiodinium natans]|uniref:MAP3K2 protein n=1 Tax=Symbiodinium natans TaxID=878477 RepID=A0A812R7T0_9DINO|nr:MAP3K2 [Symbiodinium natans]